MTRRSFDSARVPFAGKHPYQVLAWCIGLRAGRHALTVACCRRPLELSDAKPNSELDARVQHDFQALHAQRRVEIAQVQPSSMCPAVEPSTAENSCLTLFMAVTPSS
jgi:hypothetical protein